MPTHDYFIGIDEAGRGAWAGPLFVGLVVVSSSGSISLKSIGVKDSKELSESKRSLIYDKIVRVVDFFSYECVEVEVIDSIGVYASTMFLIQRLVNKLPSDFLLVRYSLDIDGKFPALRLFREGKEIEHNSVVDGDSLLPHVSAASIVAKVQRDNFMRDLSKLYPQYGFDSHKGYGTKLHMDMIEKFGLCPEHRRSFAPIIKYLNSKDPHS